jgi:hypothetical protein
MPAEPVAPAKNGRIVVSAETLAVSPEVLGRRLAEPSRRLAGMLIDLAIVGGLSWLSAPWLGLATGTMLIVLFGNAPSVAFPLKVVRWACRAIGATIVVFAVLAIGHVSPLRMRGLSLQAFLDQGPSAAMKESVFVAPDASAGQLRDANDRLQRQVEALKREVRDLRESSLSWTRQARGFVGALGVTFGWSGVYFTLLTGLLGGRTLGKLLVGTQVVKINGQPLTFFDAFVRHGGYVAGVAMGLTGFLKLLWDANRQAVEDRVASTVVVRVQDARAVGK